MLDQLTRRALCRTLAAGVGGASVSGWFPQFARAVEQETTRGRHCILLWMSGGPSQSDTFDLKPGHKNGGEFKEIATKAPGLRFSEHLPKLAMLGDRLAVLRGISTKEGDHGRGTFLMRTGKPPAGPIQYPSLGASVANQHFQSQSKLPGYVSIGPYRAFNQEAFGPGFLGPRFGPLIVGATDLPGGSVGRNPQNYPELKVQSIDPPAGLSPQRQSRRLELWKSLQEEFLAGHRGLAAKTHQTVYEGAVELMSSQDATAFDLTQEPASVREAYGRSVFGQGCLLARRLIERGVPCVEVSLGTSSDGVGWDTHSDNFRAVRDLSAILDAGWATLMIELQERGLLDSTTILWMGEFGRTPQINATNGRDHFPGAWSTVLAGGGIAGGQAYGKTSPDGLTVIEGKLSVGDLLATTFRATGVDPATMQTSNEGRPIVLSEGTPVKAVLS